MRRNCFDHVLTFRFLYYRPAASIRHPPSSFVPCRVALVGLFLQFYQVICKDKAAQRLAAKKA